MNTRFTPPAVCITGMGLCLPVGKRRAEVLRALLAGEDAMGPVRSIDGSGLASRWVSEFDPQDRDFGLSGAELDAWDRGTWFALAALQEAVQEARLHAAGHAPERIGVVVGTSHAGIQHIEKIYRHLTHDASAPVAAAWLAASATDATAFIVSRRLGARGPCATVSSACASSNTAVGVATDWLARGEADCVVVVGTDTVSASILGGFNALRAIGPGPAAPFSSPAGITLGEGAGVVVLERDADALARQAAPLAWVRGYGLSGDAYHETATDLEGRGVEAAMRHALADAGVPASAIDYVSAHGTGTDANDIPEAHATARVVGAHVPMSSPKSFLGHTLGASGVVELIVTLMFTGRGLVPPTRHFVGPRPGCPDLNYVPNQPQPHRVAHFLCNNYGFGGNNSALVVSTIPGAPAPRPAPVPVVLAGGGALTGAGAGCGPLFEALWRGQDAGTAAPGEPPAVRAERHVAGRLRLGSPRASTLIKAALVAVQEAIESSDAHGLLASEPPRCALIAGVAHGAQRHIEKLMASVFDEGLAFASATHFPLTTMNAAGGQVSIAFGLKGYNTTFCGPAGALHFAHAIVRDGRQDRALVFGADELSPSILRVLDQSGVLAREGMQAFSGMPGVVPGEGAAALMLESELLCRARGATPWARVLGIAMAQDADPQAGGAPGDGLARAARLALGQAGCEPDDVAAVVTGGVGTAALITRERGALAAVFGARVPPCASAAGVTGFGLSYLLPLHCLLAAEILRRQSLPPLAARAAPRALDSAGPILVLHAGLSGDALALLLARTDEARP